MAKKISDASQANGTSFHDTCILCTKLELTNLLGEPTYEQNNGEDKVNFEWVCETEDGQTFTIYDWKEYRPIDDNEEIEWHIGGSDRATTERAYRELVQAFDGVSSTGSRH